ncbi:M13 family metallopeptidase [Mucilaginibacter sp. KACC 22063]|uniref:M13 family metallopeptidase n=1 Tax=Mucilaginibacter sp. KACC 22063 TaxID=3025666 RepID=UPI002366D2F3|nr:M13 family metallopeptidase [Mucilaginibacter sp. KACC 22063]WDF56361.1 M13 family metallopeptidase [Mucilaginibacter sp. KACC 22063]
MKIKPILWVAMPAVLAAACNTKPKPQDETPKRTVFFDKSGMDTTVKPGDNFFEYANGTWLKKTQIPATERGWGSFYTLYDDNQKNLHHILDEISKQDNKNGSKEQKVSDLYLSGMDTAAIDKKGWEPVKPLLTKIDALKDNKQVLEFSADQFQNGDGYLLGFYVSPDDKNSTKNVAQFGQSGITLPNRDYYFKTDPESVKIRAEYLKYIAKLFTLTGVDTATAAKNAKTVLALETEIAKSHATPVELRDPVKNYNKFVVADLQKKLPGMDLNNIFYRMGFKTDTVLVGQPKYYMALNELLKTQPVDAWKTELKFVTLTRAAGYMSKDFRKAHFDFFNTVLSGQKKPKERWQDMISTVDGGLGELLGQLYVERYFTPDAKKRMKELVDNLQSVYADRIKNLDWMSEDTKKKALEKLNAFTKKIGYPDKWKNYDDVKISRDDFYKNMEAISKHDYTVQLNKLNKPVDKTEWGMTPPTVNAYYNPSFNEIVFPAGILQFPFFDKDADDAINYGAIGAVIGHEMTHGFDDQGSQYDKNGNLKVWWTKEDEAKFKAKTAAIANQYDQYVVLGNLHVNGKLTLGENIADNGGVAIAYEAFKRTKQGKGTDKIDGFTPDQRFFLSFAQVWRIKDQDAFLRMRISVDPHSPEMYRTNGPLSNTDAFYKAFNVKGGDKMFKPEAQRTKIW